jgi:L-fuconolactonase
MIIDAHQHFWERGRFDYAWLEAAPLAPIRRNFLPADLRPLIDDVGVGRTVFVQTQHNVAENRWALELAGQHDYIAGIVGWVDLTSPRCEEQLLEFTEHPKFVGVRHITQDEPDDDFIVRDDVLLGLKILEKHQVPFDLLFYVQHLHHAAALARRLPQLPMVIDHLSKPHIKDRRVDDWMGDFRESSRFPNVYCKLSGLITEADWQHWKPADIRPYVDVALECFGPARCMFGSDWPVCTLAGSYRQVYETLLEVVGALTQNEKRQVFAETAQRFYNLSTD